MIRLYPDVGLLVRCIEECAVRNDIHFGVDATKLETYDFNFAFDGTHSPCKTAIVWNLPQCEINSHDRLLNQKLVHSFLQSCWNVRQMHKQYSYEQCIIVSLHATEFDKSNEKTKRWKVRNAKSKSPQHITKNNEKTMLIESRQQFEMWKLKECCEKLKYIVDPKVLHFNPSRFPDYRVLNHLTGATFAGFHHAYTYLLYLNS
ncbi:hypothetical protein RFI_22184 [Reticulomyxa filosa]|uniref:25S rRNA (uridine-N(3))-methyltransferase BMT5-like domain-containing protein n=1 Tax=Reticulomyxa filosa TaxID=46433 RepID=X6MNC8_RETFI|nr:hypothetical protein RFI_22184 [Reticulomyxa filosa]|eukprot:ETO15176.1 hypothetical protein RFI_22184 [Reticulomyxa filosa]